MNNILVVDDDRNILSSVSMTLEAEGFVQSVGERNGDRALTNE